MIRTALIAGVLCCILALGVVAGYFSIGTQDFDAWLRSWLQNFSTEMMGALATFILFNLLLGEYEKRQQANQTRSQLTIGLHTEFQTADMLQSRITAETILSQNGVQPKPLNTSELYEEIHKKQARKADWLAVSRVLHFYENLGKLSAAGALDEKLLKTLFADYLRSCYATQFFAELANASAGAPWAAPVTALAKAFGIDTTKAWSPAAPPAAKRGA
jgi:predicted membrane protein